MIPLALIKLCFFLSVISSIEAGAALKSVVHKVDHMLSHLGWTELNDVINIRYQKKVFKSKDLMATPIHRDKCNFRLRCLTVYLGCTYGKTLKDILLVIRNLKENCENIFHTNLEKIYGYICTDKLIKIISTSIVPMVTLMRDAIIAFDLLHVKPMIFFENETAMYIALFKKIESIIDEINKQRLTREDVYTYFQVLNTIDSISGDQISRINEVLTQYCQFVPHKEDYLLKNWVEEYRAIIDPCTKSVFLRKKLIDYVKTVIIEKYFQLGFKYDPVTEETYVPTPEESIALGKYSNKICVKILINCLNSFSFCMNLELEFREMYEEQPIPMKIENH